MQQVGQREIEIRVGQKYDATNLNDERYAVIIDITHGIVRYEMFCKDGQYLGKDSCSIDMFLKWGTLVQPHNGPKMETSMAEPQIGDSLRSQPECSCCHFNKKIVPMLNKSFWYCPDCKSDLGDA